MSIIAAGWRSLPGVQWVNNLSSRWIKLLRSKKGKIAHVKSLIAAIPQPDSDKCDPGFRDGALACWIVNCEFSHHQRKLLHFHRFFSEGGSKPFFLIRSRCLLFSHIRRLAGCFAWNLLHEPTASRQPKRFRIWKPKTKQCNYGGNWNFPAA